MKCEICGKPAPPGLESIRPAEARTAALAERGFQYVGAPPKLACAGCRGFSPGDDWLARFSVSADGLRMSWVPA